MVCYSEISKIITIYSHGKATCTYSIIFKYLYNKLVLSTQCTYNLKYCIPVYFGSEIFSQKNALKFLSQITHMDKRKMWLGDPFMKLIFVTKQRNMKFVKIFHHQNKPVYGNKQDPTDLIGRGAPQGK